MKFVDLFSGIGGFHLAFKELGAKCVLACEKDRYARQTYRANFKIDNFPRDVTQLLTDEIPDFDILCAGFPCQSFSLMGYRKGFDDFKDNRGNLFFEIAKILKNKKPKAFFLENVRHIENHDNGRTFAKIKETLENLGYSFDYKLVWASEHGLPQHRPRIFMIGILGEKTGCFEFPDPKPLEFNMSDLLGGECNKKIGFTVRAGGRGSGVYDRRNWDSYLVDGKEMRLTVKQAQKLMGFPEDFHFPVSDTQALKQLGNSVAVPAVKATAANILNFIKTEDIENAA
jgi:DNA (cytosine-5)-methyltransferase 1